MPLSRHGAEVQSYPCMSVRLQETRCIPRQSEIEVVAQVDHPITGGNWIIEQDPKKSLPVMVARTVVSPNRGEIPIRVMNVGNDDITMHRDTIVAVAEQLDGNHNVAIKTVQHEKEVTKSMDPDTISLLDYLWETVDNNDNMGELEKNQLYHLLVLYSDVFASDKTDFWTNQPY